MKQLSRSIGVCIAIALTLAGIRASQAGSATWNSSPSSGDWNTAANWTPTTVPNGPSDIATFATSNQTGIALSADVALSEIVFNPGASAYTFSTSQAIGFTISGAGIINNSGAVQNFVNRGSTNLSGDPAYVSFTGTASVGAMITFTNLRGYSDAGQISFHDSSSAGEGTFVNEGPGARRDRPGVIWFYDTSSAGHGNFMLLGGNSPNANGAFIFFEDNSTAANGTFAVFGAEDPNGYGAGLYFQNNSTMGQGIFNATGGSGGSSGGYILLQDNATAGAATIYANGSPTSGGGQIFFLDQTDASRAQVQVFGRGRLYLAAHDLPGLDVGSLEGDGPVVLGSNNITVGGANRNTIYDGVMQDGGLATGGSLTKVGNGRLILTNANTYTGGTVVADGILLVNNQKGSGTGTRDVEVQAGTFGGAGTVAGAVEVGTGTGAGATLAPGRSGLVPGTLTVGETLALRADSTYSVTLDSGAAAADKVSATGVSIVSALILFTDLGSAALPPGTIFVVIENAGPGPIRGTFSNLPDGSMVTVGNNTFQADYEGGDGNDLTVTVVP